MLELNKIYNQDCIKGMQLLPDNSVDLIVTSPPYDNIRDYTGFNLNLHDVGQQISRILKDGGICVMVIQDQTKDGRKSCTSFKTIINWVTNTELDLWECCIYERSGTPGAWWNKRFRVDHEYIPIFIKGQRPQYFDKEHMKIDNPNKGKSGGSIRSTSGELLKISGVSPDKKCCGTIMKYSSSSREGNGLNTSESHKFKLQHPATFPDKLASDFIKCFTTENMIVLDPFMGSGTVAVESKKLNRYYIGFEISNEYCKIIDNRLNSKI
jgi:DNA modification methylase